MWPLYRLALTAALVLLSPWLLLRRGRHYLPTLRGRLALADDEALAPKADGSRPLWIHAVSVGEVGVAATLVSALPEDLPVVVTTVTPTGQERARVVFGSRARVNYLPLDLRGPIRRFLFRYHPTGLILIEGEFWPLLLAELEQRAIPVALVNGRISDRTAGRMLKLRRLVAPMLRRVGLHLVQTEADAARLGALGVPETAIEVTGNLKYESPLPRSSPELEATVLALAGGRPIFVAGSTMPEEESQVLEAWKAIGGERSLLVLAPRHPERFAAVAQELERAGLSWLRRSDEPGRGAAGDPGRRFDVLLLDTLGELAGLYAIATVAFVGGTLVPTGGHNPLEPARFGIPTTVGPSMHNFREMAEQFQQADAWRQVENASELALAWQALLDDPAEAQQLGERATRLVEAHRGSLCRTRRALGDYFSEQLGREPHS